MEGINNLIEAIWFILSMLNPIYHLLKQFNINENMNELLLQLISNGGLAALLALAALISNSRPKKN